jgi:uncharacterized protein DUF3108
MSIRLAAALAAALLAGRAAASEPPVSEPAAAAVLAPIPFAPGEQIDMSIDYLSIRTGTVHMAIGQPEGSVWPVICQARTDGVATLLDIREHYVTYWDADLRSSRGNDINAIEIGDRHTDRARFDRENGTATVKVMRKGRTKASTHDVPRDVHDLASALLFLRMQPLAPGARYEFPVFSGTAVFVLKAEVEGQERVETPAGRFDAIRVKVQLGFKDKFKTQRASHVWISADARRIPVRATADFAMGSIDVQLTGYRPGGQMAAAAR